MLRKAKPQSISKAENLNRELSKVPYGLTHNLSYSTNGIKNFTRVIRPSIYT